MWPTCTGEKHLFFINFSPHFQSFYVNERFDFCEFYKWKIKRINNIDLFHSLFAHIYQVCQDWPGRCLAHYILHNTCILLNKQYKSDTCECTVFPAYSMCTKMEMYQQQPLGASSPSKIRPPESNLNIPPLAHISNPNQHTRTSLHQKSLSSVSRSAHILQVMTDLIPELSGPWRKEQGALGWFWTEAPSVIYQQPWSWVHTPTTRLGWES